MTKKQQKVLGGVIAAVVVIIGVLVVFIVLSGSNEDDANTDGDVTNEATTNTADTNTNRTTSSGDGSEDGTSENTTAVTVNQDEESRIVARAKSFTERYGSYSTDNNYENIEELRDSMTNNMSSEADKVIEQGNDRSDFYGISTKSVTTTITDYEEGITEATVLVDTRRTETEGLNDPITFSQTARLQLKKVEGIWKADTFKWLD